MDRELKGVIFDAGYSKEQFAKKVNIQLDEFENKINGVSELTGEEIENIRVTLKIPKEIAGEVFF